MNTELKIHQEQAAFDVLTQPVRLSVALVTRNRPQSLERTLLSLQAQTVQPFEVVVSDDSDETHAPIVRALVLKYGCRYVSGPRKGLYANRNHVAQICMGTHIRTMDDDHAFEPDHFARCLEKVSANPDVIWIVGEYGPEEDRSAGKPVCPPQLNARGYSTIPPDPQNCWAIADGAAIYPRAVFDNGIRYAEAFKLGASYLEFGSLLYHLGYRIRHVPNTYLIHYNYERSFNDVEMHQASCFFAMFCHSFLYQPTLRNRALTCMEVAKQLLTQPRLTSRALRTGMAAFRRRQQWLRVSSNTAHQ